MRIATGFGERVVVMLGLLMIGKRDGDRVVCAPGFRSVVVVQPGQRTGCERKRFRI